MKKVKIAINGFGRIGRAAFKIALEKNNVEVVAINDLTNIDSLAYLLRHDSVYGNYSKKVSFDNNHIIVNNKKYPVYAISDPAKLPWKKHKVDVVLECTGVFVKAGSEKHLAAGAKQVIISAPAKNKETQTFVYGGNMQDFKKGKNTKIISNASCTTNCITPVMSILDKAFGVERALLTTIHAYTASQGIVDGPSKKPERGRAGAVNVVPTTTGAALATGKVLPQLNEKFDGLAIRVPVPCGSISDITVLLRKDVTVDQINNALKRESKKPMYKKVLKVTDEILVSSDIVGDSHSAIVQTNMTKVVGGDLIKILAWYDNEWGYSTRLVEQAVLLGKM